MQKALELLDQIEDIDENPYHKTRTIIFDREDMAFIKKAREELEALQQRSCESCFKNIDVQLCPCHDMRIGRDKRIQFCSEHELEEQ